MKSIRFFAITMISAFTVLAMAEASFAQVVPFKVNGSGDTFGQGLSVVGVPGPHNATGNGISLGTYTGDEGVLIRDAIFRIVRPCGGQRSRRRRLA